MTTLLQYLLFAAVIGLIVFAIAVLVFGRGEQLAPLPPRTSPAQLPEAGITGENVERVRFALALRGYRMSDVDWTLHRLGSEIDRLRAALGDLGWDPDRVSESEGMRSEGTAPVGEGDTPSVGDRSSVTSAGVPAS